MNVQQKLLTINPYSRPDILLKKLTNIVVHWVGNAGSSAVANRNYFEGLKEKKAFASSHYIVGLDGEIIQCIPDTEVAYHANQANNYSLGIEVCHQDWEGKFGNKTYNALVELLATLCKKYELGVEAIIRHYDVTGKLCPKYYVQNPRAWQALKIDVDKALKRLDVDTELNNAVNKLITAGIKMNAVNWNRLDRMDMKYAQVLLERLGTYLNGSTNYYAALDALVDRGIIADRTLWDAKTFKAEYVRIVIIRVAALIS